MIHRARHRKWIMRYLGHKVMNEPTDLMGIFVLFSCSRFPWPRASQYFFFLMVPANLSLCISGKGIEWHVTVFLRGTQFPRKYCCSETNPGMPSSFTRISTYPFHAARNSRHGISVFLSYSMHFLITSTFIADCPQGYQELIMFCCLTFNAEHLATSIFLMRVGRKLNS